MTQSVLPSFQPAPVATIPAPPPVVAPPTPWGRSDYAAAILAKLKETFEDNIEEELAKLPELQRLEFQDPWRVGSAPPGNDQLSILALFHAEGPAGDVSAYVYPIAAISPTLKVWVRYTLSRMSRMGAATMVEAMNRETFVEEIAAEWENLIDPEPEEEEPEEEEPEEAAAAPSVI